MATAATSVVGSKAPVRTELAAAGPPDTIAADAPPMAAITPDCCVLPPDSPIVSFSESPRLRQQFEKCVCVPAIRQRLKVPEKIRRAPRQLPAASRGPSLFGGTLGGSTITPPMPLRRKQLCGEQNDCPVPSGWHTLAASNGHVGGPPAVTLDNVTVTISSASTTRSPRTGTKMVCVVIPGSNRSVPVTGV